MRWREWDRGLPRGGVERVQIAGGVFCYYGDGVGGGLEG